MKLRSEIGIKEKIDFNIIPYFDSNRRFKTLYYETAL